MKLVKVKDLKKGHIIILGDLNSDNFDIAEVREISVHFKNWEGLDTSNGTLLKKGEGIINLQDNKRVVQVLNLADIIKINKMKNKIKMLEGLEDKNMRNKK